MAPKSFTTSIRNLCSAVAAWGVMVSPAAAQDAEESVDEGYICLAVANHWGGSIEDLRLIDAVPVPESFRRSFEAGGCTRFQLVEGSLLNWHLAFGSERTATAALAYVEQGLTAGRPSAPAFRDALARAWRDGLQAIAAARLPGEYGPERTAAERRLGRNRTFARAAELVAAHDDLIELTRQYVRAAEYYQSAALLAKAASYWPAVQAGLDILFRGARIANADFEAENSNMLQPHSYRINQIHDLEMRIAILRARLSRDPADIDAATAVMQRNFDPVLVTAAENAQEHSGEICEFDGEIERDDLRTLHLACDVENSLDVRTVNFWRNRAQLDLLMASDPEHYEVRVQQRRLDGSTFVRRAIPGDSGARNGWLHSFETAEQLLTGGTSRGIHERWEELPLLFLARADLHMRPVQIFDGSAASRAAEEQIETALDYLAEAAHATPAHLRPALYRRIVTSYLQLWEAPSRGGGRSWRNSEDRLRLAALFRRTLASLEAISLGIDEPGH